MRFEFSVWKEIAEMWWAEVWNNYSIDFGLISGFVLNVEEMETVFGLRMFSLNFFGIRRTLRCQSGIKRGRRVNVFFFAT